jgi:transposase
MLSTTVSLTLSAVERGTLEAFARSQRGPADSARRARGILMLADGASYTEIAATLGWSSATIAKAASSPRLKREREQTLKTPLTQPYHTLWRRAEDRNKQQVTDRLLRRLCDLGVSVEIKAACAA